MTSRVWVLGVTEQPVSKGLTRYVVTARFENKAWSDDYSTLNGDVAETCRDACQHRYSVSLDYEETRYGPVIIGVTP